MPGGSGRIGGMSDWTPQLRWRRTFENTPDDYTARAPDGPGYARVYRSVHVGHPSGPWFWAAATEVAAGSGFAPSAREAAQAAEAAWARAALRIV